MLRGTLPRPILGLLMCGWHQRNCFCDIGERNIYAMLYCRRQLLALFFFTSNVNFMCRVERATVQ